MNYENLNSFLELGYFLNYNSSQINLNDYDIDKTKYINYTKTDLIHAGADVWRESFNELFMSNKKILVPLSGGLDSRAVLAGLLEHTEAENIHTYTFGVPGALDFEIGKFIATEIGTQHIHINLDEYNYTTEELLDVSRRVDAQTMLFFHDPVWLLEKGYSDYQIWKGFLGDPLAGSHLPNKPSKNIKDAKAKFVSSNRFVKTVDLKLHSDNYYNLINFADNIDPSDLTFEEQLDLQNRQTKYIAPHVMLKGFEYKLPFNNNNFINFFLSIDNSYRRDQKLYKEMLLSLYPELFSKPTATNSGLSLRANKTMILLNQVFQKLKSVVGVKSYHRTNYFDFGKRIENDHQFFNLIRSNINDLAERNIIDWIDILGLFKRHMEGKKDYSDALIVLVSLEIHLKNGKKV